MTCVVSWIEENKTIIGADSWCGECDKHQIHPRGDKKAFKLSNDNQEFIFGFTSSYRMGQIIKHHAVMPRSGFYDLESWETYLVQKFIPHLREILKSNGYLSLDNNRESGGGFIIGCGGYHAAVHNDLQVHIGNQHTPFLSCGSGEEYAIGACEILKDLKLNTENKIIQAIEVAKKYNAYVNGYIDLAVSEYVKVYKHYD